LIALLIVTVLVNIAFNIFAGRSDQPLYQTRAEQSDSLTLITFVDAETALATTLDNQLLLLENGELAAENAQYQMLIGGIAPIGDTIYIGTADGKITALDLTLGNAQEIAAVDGRVVGMKALPDNGFLVAHGIGPFSDKYYISHFPPGANAAAFKTQVEFTIASIDAANDVVFYGTANGKIGAVSVSDGSKLWTATGKRAVTRMYAHPEGGVLVGDERGNVMRFDDQGQLTWEATATQYAVRGMAYDPIADIYFIGDTEGTMVGLDSTGQPKLSQSLAEDDLETFYAAGDGSFVVVPRNGSWVTLNAGALGGASTAQYLRSLQWLTNGALLLALLTALIMAVEALRARGQKLLVRMWHGRVAYLLITPAVICIILWSYLPTGMTAYYSLTNYSARNEVTEFIGLKNYQDILTKDLYFGMGFGNVVKITLANMLKVITMPLLVAELIFWLKRESRRYLFRTLYLLPAVVPGIIGVYLWQMVYDPYDGLLNNILKLFAQFIPGIPTDTAWLANEATALWAIIFAGFPFVSAFPLLIYMGGLININGELFDAAKIDGANWWQRFTRVDFPLLMPQTRLLLFFAFSGAVSGFADILIYTNGGPGFATYVPGLQMYKKIAEGDFGYASALGGVLFLLVLVGTLLIVRSRRSALAEI
jgi:ABC-type sugar transport system permease subunit